MIPEKFPNDFYYKSIPLEENPLSACNFLNYIDDAINFIHPAVFCQNYAIYIHCTDGICKSPSIVIGYIMR